MSESISAGVRFGWGLEGETKGEPSFRMTPVNSDNLHIAPDSPLHRKPNRRNSNR